MNLDVSANQFWSSISEARGYFESAWPRLVTAAAVFAVGLALAWVLRKVLRRAFRGLGMQEPSEAAAAEWRDASGSPGLGEVAANTAYWVTLLTALMMAVDALGLPVFGKWIAAFASYLPHLVIATAVILLGIVAGRLSRNAVAKAAARMPAAQARALAQLTQTVVIVAAILVASDQLGLDVSSLVSVLLIVLAAALGGAALAFGLGARELMSDILAMHYVGKHYRIGQVIRIGADQGRIVRTTRTAVFLESPEGELSIPGRLVAGERCMLLTREEGRDA